VLNWPFRKSSWWAIRKSKMQVLYAPRVETLFSATHPDPVSLGFRALDNFGQQVFQKDQAWKSLSSIRLVLQALAGLEMGRYNELSSA